MPNPYQIEQSDFTVVKHRKLHNDEDSAISEIQAFGAPAECAGGIAFMANQSTASGAYSTPLTSGGTAYGFSFTKHYTNTSILVMVNGSSYASGPLAISQIGYRINGLDIDIVNFFHNNGGRHDGWGGSRKAFTGLTAGAYIINPRWKATGGTINTDNNDLWTITALEVI